MASSFLKNPLVIDMDKTFGVLKYQTASFLEYVKDSEGKDTDTVKYYHYNVKSKSQRGAVGIRSKSKVPEGIKFGDVIEFNNPVVDKHVIKEDDYNIDKRITVTVDSIKSKYTKASPENKKNN